MMQKPDWFDMKITLGNVLTVSTMMVAALWWSSKIDSRVDIVERAVVRLEVVDIKMSNQIESARDQATARQEALVREIGGLRIEVARTNALLERIEKTGRQ